MISDHVGRLVRSLTSPFDADAYLSALHPLLGRRTRGVVTAVTPRGCDAASVRIRPGATWAGHRPGQFVTVGVDVDGIRHHRSFTITAVPGESTIEITVQASPEGVVSRHLVRRIAPGDVVQLSAAAGGFEQADRRPDAPLLFIAGGSGITPCLGILRALDAAGVDIDAAVLHHAVSPERALFVDELDELAARHPGLSVRRIFSRPDGAHRLAVDRLTQHCPDWKDRHAHVCGPEPMLDAAARIWSSAGLDPRLHVERFHPAPPTPRDEGAGAGDTTPVAWFRTSDVIAPVADGATLLTVAEQAGLAPRHGCRMGICHTCTSRLVSGTARDVRDDRLRCAGDAVQLCVTTAIDDVVIDD
jgi:stearoyl-CoA 9-desaturase NADPH oxidoreductase